MILQGLRCETPLIDPGQSLNPIHPGSDNGDGTTIHRLTSMVHGLFGTKMAAY